MISRQKLETKTQPIEQHLWREKPVNIWQHGLFLLTGGEGRGQFTVDGSVYCGWVSFPTRAVGDGEVWDKSLDRDKSRTGLVIRSMSTDHQRDFLQRLGERDIDMVMGNDGQSGQWKMHVVLWFPVDLTVAVEEVLMDREEWKWRSE